MSENQSQIQTTARRLFIGGPLDGHRLQVSELATYYVAEDGSTYRAWSFGDGVIFAPETWTITEVFKRLSDGYSKSQIIAEHLNKEAYARHMLNQELAKGLSESRPYTEEELRKAVCNDPEAAAAFSRLQLETKLAREKENAEKRLYAGCDFPASSYPPSC